MSLYGFMIEAIDSELIPSTDIDRLRIKICDKDQGDSAFYDNQMGEGEYSDPIKIKR